MKYLAHLTQSEGCDYTIGCGIAIITLKSTNGDDAVKELVELIKTRYSSEESQIESARIYEVTNTITFSVEETYKVIQEQRDIVKKLKQEERELKELQRLKEKYKGKV